jgi:chemotaxis protein MotB
MIVLLVYLLQTAASDNKGSALRRKQQVFEKIFREKFEAELKNNTVNIEMRQNLIQITFSDQILFDLKMFELKDMAKPVLDRCVRVLKEAEVSGYKQIQVEGHTDSRPMHEKVFPKDNWDLSVGRAVSVLKYLTREDGSDAGASRPALRRDLISANGYADTRPSPAASTNAADPLAKNRRIEIRVIFDTPQQKQ